MSVCTNDQHFTHKTTCSYCSLISRQVSLKIQKMYLSLYSGNEKTPFERGHSAKSLVVQLERTTCLSVKSEFDSQPGSLFVKTNIENIWTI